MFATPNLTTAERIRRSEYVRHSKAALARGESLEARTKRREGYANEWAAWFRARMDSADVDDPVSLLPDAMARLQELADDRAVAAINEFKKTLMGVLK
jgi:hypothetical protein